MYEFLISIVTLTFLGNVFLPSQGNYAVSGGIKGVEAVEAKAKSFKARMTVSIPSYNGTQTLQSNIFVPLKLTWQWPAPFGCRYV